MHIASYLRKIIFINIYVLCFDLMFFLLKSNFDQKPQYSFYSIKF